MKKRHRPFQWWGQQAKISWLALIFTTVSQAAFALQNNWTQLNPNSEAFTQILLDPITPTTIYAGTDNYGFLRSVDGGLNWQPIGLPNNSSVASFTIDPAKPTTFYASVFGGISGITNGIYKSIDAGASWYGINNGLPAQDNSTQFRPVALSQAAPSTLYVDSFTPDGSRPAQTYKSEDGGASWNLLNTVGLNAISASFALDPVTPTTIFASTSNGLYKSIDGGSNWNLLAFGNGVTAFGVTFYPGNSQTLFAGTNGGPFKSIDGGITWKQTPACSPTQTGCDQISAFAIDQHTPTTMYAAGMSDIYKSVDAGDTWNYYGSVPEVYGMNFFSLELNSDTQTLYALTQTGNLYATSVVPIPAAFWLFGSGVIGLFGFIRKRRRKGGWR